MKKILISLILVFSSIQVSCNEKIPEILKRISIEDKQIMEDFFRSLYILGAFAYTFLGKKPMATMDYSYRFAFDVTTSKFHIRNALISYKGMKVWDKYKHLFPSKNFILQTYSFNVGDDFIYGFTLLNKKKISKIVKSNLSIFQKFLNRKDNAEDILKLIYKDCFFDPKKEKNEKYHRVSGLLLGYSKESIDIFCHIHKLNKEIKKNPFVNKQNKELDFLVDNFKFIFLTNESNPFFPIIFPGIMAMKDDEETKKMKDSYDKIKQKVADIYIEEGFLEKILTILTS